MKNFLFFIFLILTALTSNAQAIKNGLVLNLPFNNDYNDYSGNNLNGVIGTTFTTNPYLVRSTNIQSVYCGINFNCENTPMCSDTNTSPVCWKRAYTIMDTDDYIKLASYQSKIDITNSFTISLWVYFGNTKQGSVLTSRYDKDFVLNSPGLEGLSLSYDFTSTKHVLSFNAMLPNYNESNQLTTFSSIGLQSCCGGTTNSNVVQNFQDSKWHHIVVSFDKPNLTANLYIDNLLAQTTSVDPLGKVVLQDHPLVFGAINSSSGNLKGIDGGLDNVKIYSRFLSASEVSTLYNDTIDIPSPNVITSVNPSTIVKEQKVFPNPVKDRMSVIGYDNKEYSVGNQYGTVVKVGVVKEGSIDVSDLSAGLYILQINNNSIKFIKE